MSENRADPFGTCMPTSSRSASSTRCAPALPQTASPRPSRTEQSSPSTREGSCTRCRPRFTTSRRLAVMDSMGVGIALVSLSPTLLNYWTDADEAIDYARLVNDEIAAAVAQAPDRLVSCAHLPMQDTEAAIAEVARATGKLGLRGVQVAPVVSNRPLDKDDLFPVLEAVQTAGVPATLHPYFVGASHRPGLDRYFLTNLVGHPYQTAVGATRLILSGALDRLPDLEVVLVHGGGYLPYQIGRLDHGQRVRKEARACAELPSSYLRRFTFDTLTHSAPSLRFLMDLVGVENIAYGREDSAAIRSHPAGPVV